MGYPAMTRNFKATATDTGNLVFKMQEVGFFDDAGREAIYVGDVSDWSFTVDVGGGATVSIQGNNWDPDDASLWNTISSVSSGSVIQRGDYGAKFLRATVDSFTSGTVEVAFFGGM